MFSSGAGGLSSDVFRREVAFRVIIVLPVFHMFRDVFMGCLVVFSKRSYLGSCTLDHRSTVCNSNRGQRVADYYTRVPKSAGFFFLLRLLRVSKTREVVQRAVRPCTVSLRGAELVSIDVCDPMPGLPVGQCVS